MQKKYFRLFLAMAFALTLIACGQKGPLKLPDESEQTDKPTNK